jgi:hypothetical protein
VACTSSAADPLPHYQQLGMSFAIVSASGAIHAPHLDANGMATYLLVHQGLKFIVVGIYDGKTMPDLPNPSKDGLWSLFGMAGLKFVACVAGGHDVV